MNYKTWELGEAALSFLDEMGSPSFVDIVKILLPESKIGIITDDERNLCMNTSSLYGKYRNDCDRESAYEMLSDSIKRMEKENLLNINEESIINKKVEEKSKFEKEKSLINERTNNKNSVLQNHINSTTRSIAGSVGREVGNSLIDTFFKNNKILRRVAGNSGAAIFRGIMGSLSNKK